MAPRGADEMAALQERIAALGAIQLPTLRDEWWRLYQTPPPRRLSRDLLIRGIAYKLQENAHGGLSTGAHWSGPRFFGVQGAPRAKGGDCSERPHDRSVNLVP